MTITITTSSSGPYIAAAQTTFAVTFQSAGVSEIEVTLAGVVQSPSLYVFTRDADGTGQVVFTLAVTGSVEIFSKPDFSQPTAFARFGAFFPDLINTPIDRLAASAIYLKARISILFPESFKTASSRAGKYMAWDASGNPTAAAGTGADAALRTDLAASTGAALSGFQQTGAGAIPTNLEARGRKFIYVTDFATVQQAANALGSNGDLVFPSGTYTLTAPITFAARSNVRLVGYGATITATTRFTSFFAFTGCSNVKIEGLIFDQGKASLATYVLADYPTLYNVAVHCTSACSDFTIESCNFTQLYTTSIFFKDSSSLRVKGCNFSSPVQAQDQHLEFVILETVAGSNVIDDNHFIGAAMARNDYSPCAVLASGITGSLTVTNNYAEHCGRNNAGAHRVAVFDMYVDGKNVHVGNNVALNCREQFMRLSSSVDSRVVNNAWTVAILADTTYSGMSIESGSFPAVANAICKRITVSGNVVLDTAQRQAFAIGVQTYDWGAGQIDIELSNNNITGAATAFFVAGPFDGLKIINNTVNDVVTFVTQSLASGLPPLTTTLGTEAASRFDGLWIDDNVVTLRAGSVFTPVSISTDRASPYTGTVGNFYLRRNKIKCATPGTTIAVNALFNANVAQGRFYAEDNLFEGYTEPFLLRSMVRARLTNNHIPGFTSLLAPASSAYGTLDARGNRKGDAPRRGTAVLVAGTVTVATTEIMTGDIVRATRTTTGGTVGHLSIGTITAGTSFVINSSSATDTSTVEWEIVGR